MIRSNSILTAYAAIASCFLISGLAVAKAPLLTKTETAVVTYHDLDLASDAGQAILRTRVDAAARRVCRQHGTLPIHQLRRQLQCRKEALASAEPQIARATGKAFALASRAGQSRSAQ